jgi:hypothetical protein
MNKVSKRKGVSKGKGVSKRKEHKRKSSKKSRKSKSFRKPRKSSRKPRKSSKKSTFFFKRKLDENEDIRPLKKQKNKFQNNFKFPHIHIKLENIEYHFIPHRFYKVIHSKETRHKFNSLLYI